MAVNTLLRASSGSLQNENMIIKKTNRGGGISGKIQINGTYGEPDAQEKCPGDIAKILQQTTSDELTSRRSSAAPAQT